MSESNIPSFSEKNNEKSNNSLIFKSLNFLNEENFAFEKRMIDSDIFFAKGSDIGNAERYNRGKTIHTINVWWARRPLSTMRVLLYSSLISEFNDQTINLFDELSKRIILPDSYYILTQKLLRNSKTVPKVLDPFGGNGTIAYEASNLGLEAYSIDINEYAYFIQNSLLNLGFNFGELETKELLKKHGTRILKKLELETTDFFPLRKQNITNYIWTYQITCKKCHLKYSISKRKYLSKKKKKGNNSSSLGIDFQYNLQVEEYQITEAINKEVIKNNNWKNKNSICPFCSTTNPVFFTELEDKILVGIKVRDSLGKEFFKIDNKSLLSQELMENKLKNMIEKYNLQIPKTPIEKWSGIVNPGIYGMETHSDIFNLRQKIVIITLISALLDEYYVIEQEKDKNTALFCISLLAGLLDQLIDWNSRLSMWIPENEQVGRAFCGPGIAMLWDYSEIDPILNGPANLWDKLERIINSKKSFVLGSIKPKVTNAKAQDLPFENEFFDLVLTDPPYYDNIFYSVLANFFYTWKKVLMEKIEPELFLKEKTTNKAELVSSTFRNLDAKLAHINYTFDFTIAIKEIERVCKKDGLFGLIYGHSAIEGWLPVLNAYRKSHFFITSVQPLRIERIHRPRSMKSNASNSVVLILARKFPNEKISIKQSDYLSKIDELCKDYIPTLKKEAWNTFEIGVPMFANCIGLLANHLNVIDDNGIEMLEEKVIKIILTKIQSFLPDFTIKRRKSL